jgi:hypothetical protein
MAPCQLQYAPTLSRDVTEPERDVIQTWLAIHSKIGADSLRAVVALLRPATA